jgi:hypothetical protein
LRICRMLNVHLLAIGLAEVTLVGFRPVLLVGGLARHCEDVYDTASGGIRYAPSRVQGKV